MRVSVLETDSGYANFADGCGAGAHWKITLDGVSIDDVTTADEEMGLIVCATKDANGQLQVENDEVVTQVLYGKVVIVNGLAGQGSTALPPAL